MRTKTEKINHPPFAIDEIDAKKGKKRAETVDTHNGELVKTNDLELFARKCLSAAFFQKCFRESHACKLDENCPFANQRPPWIQLYGTFSADEYFEGVKCAIKIAEGNTCMML